ncbi:MAG TPA: hypothetical protein VNN79_21155, partial [Actinomycetota bacterium]|nr:hypothetical protein [Actinomycetota bacterium]
ASGTLKQPKGITDGTEGYRVPISSGGNDVERQRWDECGVPPSTVYNETNYEWGGPLQTAGEDAAATIDPVGDGIRWRFSAPAFGSGDLHTPGTVSTLGYFTDPFGACLSQADGPDPHPMEQWQFHVVGTDLCGAGLVCSTFTFRAPRNTMLSSGSRTVHPDPSTTFTFSWSFHKHCTVRTTC